MIGARVVCLDNLSTGLFEIGGHLKGTRDFEFERGHFLFWPGKVRLDRSTCRADSAGGFQKHAVETALANSEGTRRMLEVARKSDARLFYASSSEVYGDAEVFPTPESYEGRVDPLGARSCYEEGKRFGEALCKAYKDQYGVDVRIGRIFNSYGPRLRAEGQYGRVVSRFILQSRKGQNLTVFGDGSQTRSFCYVTDTVTGILLFAEAEVLPGEVLNIGSNEETRIIDLARKIAGLTGSRSTIRFLPFPPGDHRRRVPNIEKVTKFLHWTPRVGLEQGLKETVEWVGSLVETVS